MTQDLRGRPQLNSWSLLAIDTTVTQSVWTLASLGCFKQQKYLTNFTCLSQSKKNSSRQDKVSWNLNNNIPAYSKIYSGEKKTPVEFFWAVRVLFISVLYLHLRYQDLAMKYNQPSMLRQKTAF